MTELTPPAPNYFDVTKLPPYSGDSMATRSINLMCAMLKGIDFATLFTTPFHVSSGSSPLDHIIDNVRGLHRDLDRAAVGNDLVVKNRLIVGLPGGTGEDGALFLIRKRFNEFSYPTIVLSDLFLHSRRENPTNNEHKLRNAIVDILDSVHNHTNDKMYHLCIPFIGIQLGRRPLRPGQRTFDKFIEVFGTKSMQYFYENAGTQEEKDTIAAARQAGILKEVRPRSSRPKASKPKRSKSTQRILIHEGNGKHCVDNRCCNSKYEDHWCNQTVLGLCALGSDYGTQCEPEK